MTTQLTRKFNIKDIQNCSIVLDNYLKELNLHKGKTITEIFNIVKGLVYGIGDNINGIVTIKTDKGGIGKKIEYNIFGNRPNSISGPDLQNGWEVKTTHFKKFKNGQKYNAKERLTISNVGTTDNYDSFENIKNSNIIEETKFFKKMKIILVCLDSDNKLLGIVKVDYNSISEEDKEQMILDYADIKQKINTETVSQKGQKYLHIHPHGCKGGKTRAIGYKNKFVTKIFAEKMGYTLFQKGNSCYLEIEPN